MIGPFSIFQAVGGLIGGVGGFAVGYQLFSLRRPDLGWLARQLRTLGAQAIMGIGMMLGKSAGTFCTRCLRDGIRRGPAKPMRMTHNGIYDFANKQLEASPLSMHSVDLIR